MSCMNTMWIWKAGIPPEAVFKTLVARGAGGHYVFVVPVAAQLDMKKAAAAVGENGWSFCLWPVSRRLPGTFGADAARWA